MSIFEKHAGAVAPANASQAISDGAAMLLFCGRRCCRSPHRGAEQEFGSTLLMSEPVRYHAGIEAQPCPQ